MEGLKRNSYIFAALCLAVGIAILLSPQKVLAKKTENWMEQQVPDQVNGWRFVPGNENPMQSYRMSESTYETLRPFGIVARNYEKEGRMIDVVLIASNDYESFHDPRVCFTSQQYEIKKESIDKIPTRTRGAIRATVAEMRTRDRDMFTIFFYKGPTGGFFALPRDLKLNIFASMLMGNDNMDAVFYRFIPITPDITIEELKEFVVDYMETVKETSGGYF
jgi:hypothetical protein